MRCAALAGLTCLSVLISMPAPAAVAQDGATGAAGGGGRVAADTRVNLRDAPSVDTGAVIGKLLPGDPVTIAGSTTTAGRVWYRVSTADGSEGWVAGSLIEVTAPPEAPAPEGVTADAAPAKPEPDPAPALPKPEPEPAVAAAASPAEPPLTHDWTKLIPKLLSSVDACAAVPSLQPVLITRVYEIEPNLVGVRMEDPAGRRFECLIQSTSIYPMRYEPLVAGLRPMPGDGNPSFIRIPGEPLNDECHRSDEVHDAKGETVIGWRVRDLCP
jgi:hypothetical protein